MNRNHAAPVLEPYPTRTAKVRKVGQFLNKGFAGAKPSRSTTFLIMKSIEKVLFLFFTLMFGFISLESVGQCGFTPGSYCVPFATNTSGATVTIPITCTSGTILGLTCSSELSPVSTSGIGTSSGSITVRCAANSRCPGKVMATFGSASCPGGTEMVVYKSYTQANLNVFYSAIFGNDDVGQPKPYAINATGCLDPGGTATFSVVPSVSAGCPISDVISWRFVNASDVALTGWNVRYASSDNSSITVDIPDAATFSQPCTVKVRVGTCASVTVVHAQKIIFPSASSPDVSLVNGSKGTPQINNPNSNGFPYGGVFGDRTLCIPADYGFTFADGSGAYTSNNITLQATPDESAAGVTYTWTVPVGFDLVSQSGNQAVIRVYGGTLGASGVITVRAARANSCAGDVARVAISRRLVARSGGNASNPQFGFNLPVPGLVSGTPSPTACSTGSAPWPLEVKQDYLLTMAYVPANTSITWSCTPGANPYWEFRPTGSSKANTVYATNLVTTGSTVIGRYRIPVGFTGTTPIPIINITGGTCSSTLQFTPQIKLPGTVRLSINVSGSNGNANNNLTLVNTSGAPTWPITSPCGTNNVRYVWSFQGTFTPAGGSPITYNNTEYEGTDIFNVNNVLGQNSANLAQGIYNGTFRVAVHNGAVACNNCFAAEASLAFSQTVNRPSGGGGDAQASPQIQVPQGILLTPNPASKDVTINLQELESGGTLELRNSAGISVRRIEGFGSGTRISIQKLPKGVYSVDYFDNKQSRVSQKLLVE